MPEVLTLSVSEAAAASGRTVPVGLSRAGVIGLYTKMRHCSLATEFLRCPSRFGLFIARELILACLCTHLRNAYWAWHSAPRTHDPPGYKQSEEPIVMADWSKSLQHRAVQIWIAKPMQCPAPSYLRLIKHVTLISQYK